MLLLMTKFRYDIELLIELNGSKIQINILLKNHFNTIFFIYILYKYYVIVSKNYICKY